MPNAFAKRRAHGEGDSFVTQDGGFETRRNRCIPKVNLSINKKKKYLFFFLAGVIGAQLIGIIPLCLRNSGSDWDTAY
jgi:hypothetical protein